MGVLIITIVCAILCCSSVISVDVFLCVATASIVWTIVAMTLYLKYGLFKFYYHDILGWHEPDKSAKEWNDGCSQHCVCRHCGKEIMQDSQGNWF